MTAPLVMTVQAAAQAMCLSESEVRVLIRDGEVDATKHGRVWRITTESVTAWNERLAQRCIDDTAARVGRRVRPVLPTIRPRRGQKGDPTLLALIASK